MEGKRHSVNTSRVLGVGAGSTGMGVGGGVSGGVGRGGAINSSSDVVQNIKHSQSQGLLGQGEFFIVFSLVFFFSSYGMVGGHGMTYVVVLCDAVSMVDLRRPTEALMIDGYSARVRV